MPDPEVLGDEPVRLPRARREPARRRDTEDERELLGREPRVLWRPPLWLVALVALAVVAGTAAWHADRDARRHEAAALAVCHRALHNATIFADLQLVSLAARLRPDLHGTTGGARARVAGLMSGPARNLLPGVEDADRACRSVSVRPWHLAARHRRDAAAAYSAALSAKIRAIAADGTAYYRDDPSLRRLRRAADLGISGGRY